VGIGQVSAHEIQSLTVLAVKIEVKHNYLVTVVRVNGDEVQIENLLDI